MSGLAEYAARVRRGVPLAQSGVFAGERAEGVHTVLDFRPLLPGTVVAIRVSPRPHHKGMFLITIFFFSLGIVVFLL